jgi:hypothetical protein
MSLAAPELSNESHDRRRIGGFTGQPAEHHAGMFL